MQRIGLNGRLKVALSIVFAIIFCALLVVVDRVTKNYFSKLFDNDFGTYEKRFIIDGFFYFTLRANSGAAWSFLAGVSWSQTFFKVLTCFALLMLIGVFYYALRQKTIWLQVTTIVMFAGALGNFIDRLLFNYVVDFIGFIFGSYYFPIFNVADICLTVGTIMFIVYLLFIDKNAIFKKNAKVED